MNNSFNHKNINFEILKERSFNLRWANVDNGVIPLTAADPDYPTAPVVVEAIQKFVSDGYFSYGPSEGFLFFRQAIERYFKEKRKINISSDQILPVDSAAAGISMVCQACLKIGDEAIVFNPVDFLFKYCIENAGGVSIPFEVPIDPSKELDYEKLESLITNRTRLICLCNPLNPTGKVFERSELEKIAEIAKRNKVIILSDEIWSDIVFSPNRFTSIASIDPETSNLTVTVHGFSKSYGLAGLRVGCVLTTNRELFKNIYNVSQHESTVNGCNVLGQVAASAALTDAGPWLSSFVHHLQKMRDFCLEQIQQIPLISAHSPQGCYLLFCQISETQKSSIEIQQLLLEGAKVAVVPGLPKWFGTKSDGFIRVCFSTSEETLREAFSRMNPVFESLKNQINS